VAWGRSARGRPLQRASTSAKHAALRPRVLAGGLGMGAAFLRPFGLL